MIRASLTAVALTALALIAAPAAQAQVEWRPLGEGPVEWTPLGAGEAAQGQRPEGPQMSTGTQAVLRGLDKVSGEVEDLPVAVGDTVTFGRLSVALTACRYPADNPASDAFAFLTISDTRSDERVFQGWMIGSSPALNALDHPRYDIWVLSCS
ncbi:DUF2155 domain-containing protein [Pararhodobacter marinus]|uniref:DUF2155 domain-containing protein n=1 Tax=Pararhodobacter marinus TaxID=2184063 RepID=UPI00351657C9